MFIPGQGTAFTKVFGQQSDSIYTGGLVGNFIPSTGVYTHYWDNQVAGQNNLRRFNSLSKTNSEDINTRADDHAYDALRYMLMTRMTGYVSIHKTLGGIKNQVYQMQDQTFGY